MSDGRMIELELSNIEEIKPSQLSLMPDDLVGHMTAQKLADVLPYFETLKTQYLPCYKTQDRCRHAELAVNTTLGEIAIVFSDLVYTHLRWIAEKRQIVPRQDDVACNQRF